MFKITVMGEGEKFATFDPEGMLRFWKVEEGMLVEVLASQALVDQMSDPEAYLLSGMRGA